MSERFRKAGLLVAIAATLLGTTPVFAVGGGSGLGRHAAHLLDLEQWLQSQVSYSAYAMLANIGPSAAAPEASPGAVLASPSRDPDYRYHWVRDAALVMETVSRLGERSHIPSERSRLERLLLDFTEFSRRNQQTPNPSLGIDGVGFGEPKFHLDGRAFVEPWGRPQNDGPALRALTLTRFAHHLLDTGRADLVRERLYDTAFPPRAVIKADLEFVSHRWRDPSFDLWEEVRGAHFYTRLVQRQALIEGAELAKRLGDGGAAQWYLSQAKAMEEEISRHWDAGRGIIVATLERNGGLDYKSSGLDVAVVLAALHASPRRSTDEAYFGVTDDRVLSTAERIAEAFRRVFPINQRERDWEGNSMGVGIGRYPEDRYGGIADSNTGNPWFLATHAFGELYYRCAREWEARGEIRVTPANVTLFRRLKVFSRMIVQVGGTVRPEDPRFHALIRGLRQLGDDYMRRSRFHAAAEGAMSEQFNRDSGFMQGAAELTWSHASLLTAAWAR
jgi:glucoamylase